MRRIVEFILRYMAKAILFKYRPVVIGVTGSVGKTTTKDAILYALSSHLFVSGSEKNFNNEIGIPLTILGCGAPGRSLIRWLRVGLRFVSLMVFSIRYPKVLVLEFGVDRPGDMRYLLSIVRPTIAVVTEISSSHIEFFGSLDAIAEEKGKLVEALSPEGYAILNADDTRVFKMRKRTQARLIGYGFHKRSTLRAFNDSVVCSERGLCGMRLKIQFDGKTLPIRLKNLIAKHHIYAVLAAISVADVLKIPLLEVIREIEDFRLSPGRLQPIPGLQGSWIFDDTYNASPTSTSAAIETMEQIPFGRKILVLGDMLELGSEEIEGHISLAKSIMRMRPDGILLVGRRMRILGEKIIRDGFDKRCVKFFEDPVSAGKFILKHLQVDDIVLVKGSQGMRMELAVEQVMAHPEQAERLLCRQTKRWKEIPYAMP